jgi:hypothetical protein
MGASLPLTVRENGPFSPSSGCKLSRASFSEFPAEAVQFGVQIEDRVGGILDGGALAVDERRRGFQPLGGCLGALCAVSGTGQGKFWSDIWKAGIKQARAGANPIRCPSLRLYRKTNGLRGRRPGPPVVIARRRAEGGQ